MSRRSTFSIAQLLLLVMLTGLLCAWLPKTANWGRENRVSDYLRTKLSADCTRLIAFDMSGFAVFETVTGRCLLDRRIPSMSDAVFDEHLTSVCFKTWDARHENDPILFPDEAWTIYDVDTASEREVVAPPMDTMAIRWPLALDESGCFVEMLLLGNPNRIRRWNLQTGKLVPDSGIDLDISGRIALTQGNGLVLCRDIDERLFIRWRLPSGEVIQTALPTPGAEIREWLCLNRQQDKVVVLMHEIPGGTAPFPSLGPGAPQAVPLGGPPVPRPVQRYLVIAEKTGRAHSLKVSDFYHVGPAQMTADDRYLLAFASLPPDRTVYVRIDLETGDYEILSEFADGSQVGEDFKLINNDQQIALAKSDGTFRLLDANTGREIRRVKCVRDPLGSIFWYVMTASGMAWNLMWWFATRRIRGEPFDAGRYAIFAVFLVALTQGIVVLAYFDPWGHSEYPPFLFTVGVTTVLSLLGMALLFFRSCNKLSAAYTMASSAGIAAYTFWLMQQRI